MSDWKKKVEAIHLEASDGIPNNPSLPVLLCRQILDPSDDAADDALAERFESCFQANGWAGVWRWGVYDFHHFHSTAHEVLGVARGSADLRLGGPGGLKVSVRPGDVLILPAGTGHKNEGSSEDFQVVGAYPEGQTDYDLIKEGEPVEDTMKRRIRAVPVPEKDPVLGDDGPVALHWR